MGKKNKNSFCVRVTLEQYDIDVMLQHNVTQTCDCNKYFLKFIPGRAAPE